MHFKMIKVEKLARLWQKVFQSILKGFGTVVEVYLYKTGKQLKSTVYDLVVVGVVQEDLKKDRFLISRRTGREKDLSYRPTISITQPIL